VVVATAIVACAVGVGGAAWFASPTPSDLGARVHTRLAGSDTRPVALDAIAPVLRDAVVATEDERFYRHRGVDLIGVARAVPYDASHASLAQGASTITEQVAKVLYMGGNDHDPWRKLEDAAVALKLEGRYTKQQILAAYLNSVYFGEGAYGVRAASERYFGVTPARLGIAQATLLAGLIQAPSADDPLRFPSQARERQADVLRALVRTGYLTTAVASTVLRRPLRLRGGAALPAHVDVSFSVGPAFVWWQLALGVVVAGLGAGTVATVRRPRLRSAVQFWSVRVASVGALVGGVMVLARSFRSL